MDKIKILYIFGSGHSGSTLASLILGAHSRIECVGEMKNYEQSIRRGRACNCGAEIFQCLFWKEVHRSKGIDSPDQIPPLNTNERERFGPENHSFLGAVLDVAGKDVLCDHSKTKKRIFKYLASAEFEVRVLHLLRDARAVALSNSLKGRSFWNYTLRWIKRNSRELKAMFRCGLTKERYYMMRYEDLALMPEATLVPFLNWLGLEFQEQQLQCWSGVNHHIAGNRMARNQDQPIRLDRRYVDQLSFARWAGASILSGSLLRRYGYSLNRENMKRKLKSPSP